MHSNRRIANPEGPSEDRVEPPRRDRVINRRLTQAEAPQLGAGHDPMLAPGQLSHRPPNTLPTVPLPLYPELRHSEAKVHPPKWFHCAFARLYRDKEQRERREGA